MHYLGNPGGGEGDEYTPLYKLDSYVQRQRTWFLSRSVLKKGGMFCTLVWNWMCCRDEIVFF